MSDRQKLERLVKGGESHFLEFKRKVDNPAKIVKELVGFSNADGGTLLVGVTDEGRLAGLDHPGGDWFILEQAIQKHTKPVLKLSHHLVSITSSRSVIVIEIPASQHKPVSYRESAKAPREVFVRVKDECIRASREWAGVMAYSRRRIFIRYGEQEQALMSYLGENPQITLKEFCRACKVPKRIASRVLVNLTAAGVLQITPGIGNEDRFSLA